MCWKLNDVAACLRKLKMMLLPACTTILLAICLAGCGASHPTVSSATKQAPLSDWQGIEDEVGGQGVAATTGLESCVLERVVDGDTIVVDLDGRSEKVRLIGIDAPESVHPDEERNVTEGEESSAYLKSLVSPGQTLYLQRDVSDTDRYGRLLRYVWLEAPGNPDDAGEVTEKMLNAIIVESGHAQAKDYAPDTKYSRMFHSL